MEYAQGFEQASEYAKAALKFMAERGIAPHPNNFTIWFHYFAGTYPDLKRTLDILIGNSQTFGEDRSAEIFQKFFAFDEEGEIVSGAATKIEQELKRIVTYLDDMDKGTAAYGKQLARASSGLAASQNTAAPLDSIRSIVTGVMTATEQMQERNQSLEHKLSASSQEISQLRQDLDVMRHEALTDALTGIANRKLFDTTLRHAAMHAMENGEDLALLMLDIDHFKNFNDTHGHQIGDQVLKLVGITLQENVKGHDTAARYGGEEFAVILPRTNLMGAVTLGEQIRKAISSKTVINRKTNSRLGRITLSVGASRFEMGEALSNFIGRADAALYQAKRSGRNRVVSQDEVKDAELILDS